MIARLAAHRHSGLTLFRTANTDPPLRLAYLAPANYDLLYIELIDDGSLQPKPDYTNFSDSLRQAGYHHFCLNVANLDNTIAEL